MHRNAEKIYAKCRSEVDYADDYRSCFGRSGWKRHVKRREHKARRQVDRYIIDTLLDEAEEA